MHLGLGKQISVEQTASDCDVMLTVVVWGIEWNARVSVVLHGFCLLTSRFYEYDDRLPCARFLFLGFLLLLLFLNP